MNALPVLALTALITSIAGSAAAVERLEYALVVHGGAGGDIEDWPPEKIAGRKQALRKAVLRGRETLAAGGAALDAVEQVIRLLEDDPQFNAGRGAVLNSAGGHELDASIMDGRTKRCGAVAGVISVKNPISLARLVMTETRHVLLGGPGAEQFAREQDLSAVPQSYFRTDQAVKEWEQVRRRQGKAASDGDAKKGEKTKMGVPPRHMGTVGCAALDRHGDLAAGTSTGGLTNKKFGRIGDSPVIGAGTYADNATCAVSCTGIGEQYIRNAISYDISAQIKYGGRTLKQAVRHAMRETLQPGDGGIIAVDRSGEIVIDFTTKGMARAAADSTGRVVVELGGTAP